MSTIQRAMESLRSAEPGGDLLPVLEEPQVADDVMATAGATAVASANSAPATQSQAGSNNIVMDEATGDGTTSEQTAPSTASKASDVHEIPLAQLERSGMVTPSRPRSRIAEEYRSIKRPLLMNIDQNVTAKVAHPNLIMVTSAVSGEGKTFSAINLAISIAAEQDRTVLLVDADVAKSSAVKILGIDENRPGLIDLLEGRVNNLADILLETNIAKLKVLPAGKVSEHATELLASDNMNSLMRELSTRYADRVIIFDSPPLLMTTEACALASHVGQVVMVVAAEQSAQDAVSEAITHIGEDKIIGLLLNKIKHNPLLKLGYGYGYGYGYGDRYASKVAVEPS